ncbi:MAG: hypothetical protein U0359_27695 [Byssovorax sp.]
MIALAIALGAALLIIVEVRARASRKRDEALLHAVDDLHREVRRAIPLAVEVDGETLDLGPEIGERLDDLADRLRAGEHPEFAALVQAGIDADDDPSKTRH